MPHSHPYLRLDQPARYSIRVLGRLEGGAPDWFQGEVVCVVETTPSGAPVTCLAGQVADQAALHGLLSHIRDLGLVLLSVKCLSVLESEPVVEEQ